MERKIGEIFEYHVKMLRVELGVGCNGCYFIGRCIEHNYCITGECNPLKRQDNKKVIFVEVKDEQPQEQAEQPQELNLCEILKNCPEGETFWSPMLGDVKFSFIDEERQMIFVETIKGLFTWEINADGTISIDEVTSPEIMLYPSKEQRDWSKFTAPWLKKERFDPKTLKPFDKVLARDHHNEKWCCDIFSNIDDNEYSKYITISYSWKYCIPYNDDTKHLVGTTDEAPEFYRYWED